MKMMKKMELRIRKAREELLMWTKCPIFNPIKIKIKGMKTSLKTKTLRSLLNPLLGQEEDTRTNSIKSLILSILTSFDSALPCHIQKRMTSSLVILPHEVASIGQSPKGGTLRTRLAGIGTQDLWAGISSSCLRLNLNFHGEKQQQN